MDRTYRVYRVSEQERGNPPESFKTIDVQEVQGASQLPPDAVSIDTLRTAELIRAKNALMLSRTAFGKSLLREDDYIPRLGAEELVAPLGSGTMVYEPISESGNQI